MKQFRQIVLLLTLLTPFFLLACDNEKEDDEKRENVQVNHTYNKEYLTVLIENKNEEEVRIEIYARYNSGISGASIEYIHDKVSIKAHDRLQKEYPLTGDIPNTLELTYKVY